MELEPIDGAILRCLQDDARASLRTIAKQVGVSVPTVSAHLRNLEELGIVRGYRVLLAADQLDSTNVTLIVSTTPAAVQEVARRLASRDWARRVLTGPSGRILVDVGVDRPEGLPSLLREVEGLPRVTEVQPFAGLKTVKDEPVLLPRDRLTANVACFECKGPIHGEPVKVRRGGRYHYFCCTTCKRLYLEKYDRIRSAVRSRG